MLARSMTPVWLAGLLAVAAVPLSGCLADQTPAPSQQEGLLCMLGGPPREGKAAEGAHRLDEEHLEGHPVLRQVFETRGHSAEVDCTDATRLFHHLANEGATVRWSEREVEAGHRTLLSDGERVLALTIARVA